VRYIRNGETLKSAGLYVAAGAEFAGKKGVIMTMQTIEYISHYIVGNHGARLSQFVPNDVKPKLLFRNRDWYLFGSYQEAQNFILHIQQHGIGKNLTVRKAA
jgi:hypothetical protein